MKVLVVTTWLPTRERPEIGSFIVRDIQMLRLDHEVDVIHLSADGTLAEVPFAVETIRMSPSDPRSVRKVAPLIAARAASADVVHSMAASTLLPFRCLELSSPWVHTEHWSALLAPATAPLLSRLAIPLTRRLLARPDAVIAVGHDLAAAIGRSRQGRTVVIPNDVQRPRMVRERPNTPVTTLVGVGGLITRKGPDLAVRALAALIDRGRAARLIWAGDGPLRAEVLGLATSLGVGEQVELRGRMEPSAVEGVLAEADVFVLPTRMETFGVAIAEALVAGRPVVTSATGEQASFVEEPDGVLVTDWSAEAYADGVERVLALNEGRSAESIAARARARFDPERRRSDTFEVYESVLKAGHARLPRDVDVIVAAHDPRRNIARAVSSALTSRCVWRVQVVCHNITVDEIRSSVGEVAGDPRVEFVELHDGIPSPAGPFNAGLQRATGRYAMVLGSDDELTVGAIDAWRSTALSADADVVIAPLRHAEGAMVPTPPTVRYRDLHGARDRLAYRTAPLGLISLDRFGDLRFTPGLATGEDLAFSTRMWFSGARIEHHHGAGEYWIHDGDGRVTFTHRAIGEELHAVSLLLADASTLELGARDRLALAVKLWRLPVFGAIHYRAGAWEAGDLGALREVATLLREFSPAAVATLSRADNALIDAIEHPKADSDHVDKLSRRRRRFLSISALVPAVPLRLFAREAPLRFAFATWWVLRR